MTATREVDEFATLRARHRRAQAIAIGRVLVFGIATFVVSTGWSCRPLGGPELNLMADEAWVPETEL